MPPKLVALAIVPLALLGGAALVRLACAKEPPPSSDASTLPAPVNPDHDAETRKLAADILEARQKAVEDARAGRPAPVYFAGSPIATESQEGEDQRHRSAPVAQRGERP